MERVEVLELAKSLFNKEELTEDEILEWNSINRTEDLTDALTERMDNDHALTVAVLDYLTKSGTNLDQIIFSAVAIGNYLLEKFRPDDCGYDRFHEFWIEQSWLTEEAQALVDRAVNNAFDNMISNAMKERHDEYAFEN